MRFVFPLAAFVKQRRCMPAERQETPAIVEDLTPSMHANDGHSQAAPARNCVQCMAVDLFLEKMRTRAKLTCRRPLQCGVSLREPAARESAIVTATKRGR
jgi:hypothetical protein